MPEIIRPAERTHFTSDELAAALSELPPGTPVYVRGYEDGVNYITSIIPISVRTFENTGTWYYGEHEECYKKEDGNETGYELVGGHVGDENE